MITNLIKSVLIDLVAKKKCKCFLVTICHFKTIKHIQTLHQQLYVQVPPIHTCKGQHIHDLNRLLGGGLLTGLYFATDILSPKSNK
jgi:hypothetical protein